MYRDLCWWKIKLLQRTCSDSDGNEQHAGQPKSGLGSNPVTPAIEAQTRIHHLGKEKNFVNFDR
jgi:hypothetical protein